MPNEQWLDPRSRPQPGGYPLISAADP